MNRKNLISLIVLTMVAVFVLAACAGANTEESTQVNKQQQQYLNSQPAPYFEWSLERHLMTELYKARNNAVSTWSYTQSQFTGKITWECPSIGYPIPGGTELTNPEAYAYNGVALPQAEPNGLYTPATSAGTYVMCVNPDGTVSPQYVEDNVHTSPVPMQEVDGKLVPVEGQQPSIKIQPKQP